MYYIKIQLWSWRAVVIVTKLQHNSTVVQWISFNSSIMSQKWTLYNRQSNVIRNQWYFTSGI